jgi:hypothetical protein
VLTERLFSFFIELAIAEPPRARRDRPEHTVLVTIRPTTLCTFLWLRWSFRMKTA